MPDTHSSWFERVVGHTAIDALVAEVSLGGGLSAQGAWGSSTALVAAAIQARLRLPMLLVTAHLDDADEALDELAGLGIQAARLPAIEVAPGQDAAGLDQMSERLVLVRRLLDGDVPQVLVAPIHALMQGVPDADRLASMLRVIKTGDRLEQGDLVRWLDGAGYKRVDSLESPGEFAVRGGIVDICLPGSGAVRLDFFGEEVESLHAIDLESMGSDRRLDRVEIASASASGVMQDEGMMSLPDVLPESTIAILAELIEIQEQGRSYFERVKEGGDVASPQAVIAGLQRRCQAVIDINQYGAGAYPERRIALPVQALPTFDEAVHDAMGEVIDLARRIRTVVLCQTEGEAQRTRELIVEASKDGAATPVIETEERYVHRGFIWGEDGSGEGALALVPHHEIVHRYQTRRRIRQVAMIGSAGAGEPGTGGRALDSFVDLQAGDYVVHQDHGIARFAGLKSMQTPGGDGSEEFLTLEFSGRAKLHVPASRIELVQKYIGGFRGAPELSTMGGRKWANQKQRVSEAVKDLAAEMLRLQAARESMPGIRYPADTPWQHEFDAEFPYEETPDQVAAIASLKRDMADPKPMDRLVCGDVGFGKTEVAMRGTFKAAEYGKQVAVLVPTTVLAEQHERTFRERFADYPFRIESLSRFKTGAEQNAVLKALATGQVDVVIGTHRLLSGDVTFSDLGLVVIDEEQRFGVEHKQKLLAFRATVGSPGTELEFAL